MVVDVVELLSCFCVVGVDVVVDVIELFLWWLMVLSSCYYGCWCYCVFVVVMVVAGVALL